MKKRLPIKGWQWDQIVEKLQVKQLIKLRTNSERKAFGRACIRAGAFYGTYGSKPIQGWIISKKGKRK